MTNAAIATTLADVPILTSIPVEHIADLSVDIQPPVYFSTFVSDRLVAVSTGGRLTGPRLDAELLPGGGDTMVLGTDGIARVDAQAVFQTGDGALIHYTARGVVKLPPDGLGRLAAGDPLAFGETYIRTTPKFETADERYSWLNGLVMVSQNLLSATRVEAHFYAIA